MSDARCATSYVPACALDQTLASRYGVTDQTSYRMALQRASLLAYNEQRKLYVCQPVNNRAWFKKNR